MEKIAIKMETRAVKFKENLRRLEEGRVRIECVRLIDLKRRDKKTERERLTFFESRGWSERKWEIRMEEGLDA